MTKDQIIKYLCPQGNSQIDVAVPLNWSIKVRELGIEPSFFAIDYRKNPLGEPLNLLEVENEILKKTIEELVDSNIQFVKKIKALEEDNK